MKIEGWDKINGFTYKGYAITNAYYDEPIDVYKADILNLNDTASLCWHLALTPNVSKTHLLRIFDNAARPGGNVVQKGLLNNELNSLAKFRVAFEGLVEEMELQLSWNKASGKTGGIINQVQNVGTAVTYSMAPSSHSISNSQSSLTNSMSHLSVMQQALNAMKELEEQLDKLKKEYPL